MRPLFFLMSLLPLHLACGADTTALTVDEEKTPEAVAQPLALFYYAASETNCALESTQSARSTVFIAAEETIMLGTCGVSESAAEGNTVLRLFGPDGSQVASNDDGSSVDCLGGSKLAYLAPVSGNYLLQAGCFASSTCAGTVALSRRKGLYAFNVSQTDNATRNTSEETFWFEGGAVARLSTCARNAHGAVAEGDTYLRLFQHTPDGEWAELAAVDNTPGCGTASEIVQSIPSPGYYRVKVGCANTSPCSGQLAVYTE